MANFEWEVRLVWFDHGTMRLKYLGLVEAPHQPAALRKAWDKWPAQIDASQVQGGFTLTNIGKAGRGIKVRAPIG